MIPPFKPIPLQQLLRISIDKLNMIPFTLKKSLPALTLVILSLFGCASEVLEVDGGFAGIGQGHVSSIKTTLQGEVRLKNFEGGEIIVEARAGFPCQYGWCPVIGTKPLGYEKLPGPGPYALPLKETGENLVIIASYFDLEGNTRVAHRAVKVTGDLISGADLSLDRPYPPLR